MTTEKVIKTLEYMKTNAGLPEQGYTWSPNAETIALDEAIKAIKIVQELPKIIEVMDGFRNEWMGMDLNYHAGPKAKVETWNTAIELVSELIKTEEE